MFTKRVWFDKRHLAEVFLMDDTTTIGTIVAYEGTVFLINPVSEMLSALYQESRLKRILGIRGILLTSASVAYARGVCALVNYSRVLSRRTPISIMMPFDETTQSGVEFISRCCRNLVTSAQFELSLSRLAFGESGDMGKGEVVFLKEDLGGRLLRIRADRGWTLHYHDGDNYASTGQPSAGTDRPDVVIRESRRRRVAWRPGGHLVMADETQT